MMTEMRTRQTTALALAMTFAAAIVTQPALLMAQGAGNISGTASNEAKKPYTNYSVRARHVQLGSIAATIPLDPQGNFTLAGIDPANYLVELVDAKGKVVCTEGPFDLTKLPQSSKPGVNIACGNPQAWWLLAAAGAAGITVGVVANDPVTPGARPAVTATLTTASASR
jgi:hypothetical protein